MAGKMQDHDLMSLAGWASLAFGLGRPLWALLLSRMSPVAVIRTILVCSAVAALLMPVLLDHDPGFKVSLVMGFLLLGQISIYPLIVTSIFGVRTGSQVYGLLFQAFAVSALLTKLLESQLMASGVAIVYYLEAALCLLATFWMNGV